MKSLWILPAAALFVLAVDRPARADAMLDPCMMMGKKVGDPCTTPANQPGTCVQGMTGLICQANGSSSSASGNSSSSGASSGNSGSGSGSGSGSSSGSGAGGAGGSSSGGDTGGCSCRTGEGEGEVWG